MSDIIQILPDSVANQIAAGEVIQRPASVVKELVENAIDAGAKQIQIYIKDAGRTLVQVIDNGCGMSDTDARLAFERHATSKIKSAEDIFNINTKGFRGEALPSIASVAQVECKTRKEDAELGTHIIINGSTLEKQESISCKTGTNFIVKNLFYNIPVRRKFLKSNNLEYAHIVTEFYRIALAHPDVALSIYHNDKEEYILPTSNVKQRIISLFGKNLDKQLLTIQSDTNLVKIRGYIGKPETAKKRNNEQFFFINDRFMRHRSFYGAVMRSYEKLIVPGSFPMFYIYLEVSPSEIDINIHPTKTEIKFTNEYQISQILEATVKEALGKFNIVPSIDFSDTTDYSDMFAKPEGELKIPGIDVQTNYNPFEKQNFGTNNGSAQNKDNNFKRSLDSGNQDNWEAIYNTFHQKSNTQNTYSETKSSALNFENTENEKKNTTSPETSKLLQLKGRYIITTVKSGMMIVDQKRAHERILYERFIKTLSDNTVACQIQIFPLTIEIAHNDVATILEMQPELKKMGFDIDSFGQNMFVINGTPAHFQNENIKEVILNLIETYNEQESNLQQNKSEQTAKALAKASAIQYNRQLNQEEMQKLIDELFACSLPSISADGKKTLEIVSIEEIMKRF